MKNNVRANTFSQNWKLLAKTWGYGSAPARPSDEDVQCYRKYIEEKIVNKKQINVLVLGATPEIRDMLRDYGKKVNVVICDVTLEMVIAMSSIMKVPNTDEVVIRANWVDAPLTHSYFDVILGDAVLHNLPKDLQKVFLAHQRSLLKDDGLFVTRVAMFNQEKVSTIHNAEQIFEIYLKNPENPWGASEIFVTVMFASMDNGVMSTKKMAKFLKKFWDPKNNKVVTGDKMLDKWLNNPFNIGWWEVEKDFHVGDRKSIEKMFKKDFKIREHFVPEIFKSHPVYELVGGCLPFYCLTPKK